MDSPEQAAKHHQENAPSFDLTGMTAHQILGRFGGLVEDWWVDRERNPDAESGSHPSWHAIESYYQATRERIGDDPELARDCMRAIDESHPDVRANFSDMMLFANVGDEFMRHDPAHGREILVRGLLSEHGEVNIPARFTLRRMILERSLPPEVLADTVFRFATVVDESAYRMSGIRAQYTKMTRPSGRYE